MLSIRGGRRRRRSRVAVGVVVALLVSGCGARWDQDQQALVVARYGEGGGGSAAASGRVGTAASSGQTGGAGTAQAGSAQGATTGDASGSGGAEGGGAVVGAAAGGAALPCAAPTDAPGVTDESITIGTINSLSGPVPGLGATSEAAVRSYVAYRNATGGVCGRQIELLTADDGTDSGRFRAVVVDLGPRVLGFAGVFANGDGGGAELVEEQQIPVVGPASTTTFQNVSTVFDINPPPPGPVAFAKHRYLVEQGVRTAAVATLSNDAAVAELDAQQAQIEAAGIQVVSRQILPVTTLSFDSAARAVANSGAQYLFFLGAENHDAAMAQAMRDSGYTGLLFEEYLTGYGETYLGLAGAAAEGTTSWIRTLPTEDGGTNAEQAAFVEWMSATAPDASPDVYAAQSWASAKAFLDSLEALPGPITREALLGQLRATTSFDAGGFLGTINLGGEQSGGCLIGMRVEGGAWRRLTPPIGFLC